MPAAQPEVQEDTGLDAFAEPQVVDEAPDAGFDFAQPEPVVSEDTAPAFNEPEAQAWGEPAQ